MGSNQLCVETTFDVRTQSRVVDIHVHETGYKEKTEVTNIFVKDDGRRLVTAATLSMLTGCFVVYYETNQDHFLPIYFRLTLIAVSSHSRQHNLVIIIIMTSVGMLTYSRPDMFF
jgi:hypothetical protein